MPKRHPLFCALFNIKRGEITYRLVIKVFSGGIRYMNDPMKMKSESWKKTVERYREDMMNLAKQNERFSRPKQPENVPMPLPEPPQEPETNDQKLREEQELQRLFERIREAREEIERLELEKRELEQLVEQQREQIQPRPQPRSDREDTDYWSVENMRRLPNSIPVPERELPFDNSSVVMPPPNEGPGESDNDIIDFNREPAEWETRTTESDEFNQSAVFAQTTENTEIDITENNFSSFAPNGDRILRPDYRMARVTEPVERLEKSSTNMQNTPQQRAELTGNADLIVQVFTARQALPISGATVTVSRIAGDEGRLEGLAVHITDENGKTPAISLPTPPKYLSEAPGNIRPYSEYVVDVKKSGYFDNVVRGIQMFDSITTIEPVNMIPLPMGQDSGKEQFDISDYEL